MGSSRDGGHLYALDFDGVLCDSCEESSISALKAANVRWPELFSHVDLETRRWLLDNMRVVRPAVETGYDNVLLVRLLLELHNSENSSAYLNPSTELLKGLTVDGILEDWEMMKPLILRDWGEDKDTLVNLFGSVRDEWIASDLPGWISVNRFYPGTADALKFATSKVYIVTTKQTRFAQTLLKQLAGMDFPCDQIYGLGSGPKTEVLRKLQNQPEHQGLTLHFIEDRLATLQNVIKQSDLVNWNLYLGTWGYNTSHERKLAMRTSRINTLDLIDFCNKLK